MFEKLDNKNFILYAAKHYNNPYCTGLEEFHEDLRRIKYIKKLITRYQQTGDLKCRLILNHIIILNNVFGPEALVRIIFFKMKKYLVFVKPFLLFLNLLPEIVYINKDEPFYTESIPMDNSIIEELKKI